MSGEHGRSSRNPRGETGLALLCADVRAAARALRGLLRRGDLDDVTRRRLLLEVVVDLELAVARRGGAR